MNRKVIGTVLGTAGALLWFMPWAKVEFMGLQGFQAGNHIGGLAYLILLASIAYAVLSWLGQHVPRIVTGAVALGLSVLHLINIGGRVSWGLLGLLIVSIAAVVLAVQDNKTAKVGKVD